MPSTPRIVLLAVLLGVGGVLSLLQGCSTHVREPYGNPNELFREIGYEDAVQLSASQKKPMFLFFSESWVKDREKLLSRTLTSTETRQLLHDRTIGLQIELTDLPDIAKKHRVTSAPLLVLVAPDGKEIRRWKGLPRAESFVKELTLALDPAFKGKQFAEADSSIAEP
ncbi:MAG: hypothetical protein QM715_04265 [Nibricoccus sp.]